MKKITYIIISLTLISLSYFTYKTYSLQKQVDEAKAVHNNDTLILANFLDQATQGQLSAYIKQLQTKP